MSKTNSNHIFKQLPEIVFNHQNLSAATKIVFMVLWDVIKDKGSCRHRNKTIAAKANISERTVARCLNSLEKYGLLIRSGMSFNRKFVVGNLFALSKAVYIKIKQIKKNLHSSAKNIVNTRPNGKHTKNLPNNINIIELEKLRFDEQQRMWYKNNPLVAVKKCDEYLFL